MSWQAPWVLLLGLLLGPYLWWRRRRAFADVTEHPPLQYQADQDRARAIFDRPWLVLALEAMILLAAIVALAGPYTQDEIELIEAEGIDVMLVLDVSTSMLAADFEPSRIDVLRSLAKDFVARAAGHRLGILIFAGDVFVQCPLTTDRTTLGQLLDGVAVESINHGKSGGTAVGDALLLAEHRLTNRRLDGRDQAIILITDGDSNLGFDPMVAAQKVRESNIRPYFIGVGGLEPATVEYRGELLQNDDGTPYLTSLDDGQLQALAETSGGRYDRALDERALERILSDLARLESAPLEARRLTLHQSKAWPAALVALGLLVLHLGLESWTRRPFR